MKSPPTGYAVALALMVLCAGWVAPATLAMAAPSPAPGYRLYAEPTAHAFSVQVPQGWSVEGEILHPSPRRTALHVAVLVPHGVGRIDFVEPYPTMFLLPGPALEDEHVKVGEWFEPLAGERFQIQPYRAPHAFLQEFLACTSRPPWAGMKATSRRTLPELARQFDAAGGGTQTRTRVELLDVEVAATQEHGQALVATQQFYDAQSQVGGWIGSARAWTARDTMAAATRSAFEVMLATLRIDPAWWKAQQKRVAGSDSMPSTGPDRTRDAIRRAYPFTTVEARRQLKQASSN